MSWPTYLTRPVFPFSVDWTAQPKSSWSYDLREIDLGFGAIDYSPTGNYITQGCTFSFQLLTEADVAHWEAFTTALIGPLTGFWLPKPSADFALLSVTDTTHVVVAAQDLVDTWDAAAESGLANPEIHVAFTKYGQSPQFARITAVATVGGGEQITLDAAVTVDATWSVSRVLYVRLAKDEEQLTVQTDGWATITLDVIELPNEYTALATGTRLVYLYRFYFGGPGAAPDPANDWFYTSFQSAVSSTYGGAMTSTSHASHNVTHSAIKDSMGADTEQCTIEAVMTAGSPFAQLVPMTLPQPLWVDIRSATVGAPNTTTLLLTGQVLSGPGQGRHLKLKVASIINSARGQRFPRMMIQRLCNYRLYDPATCKVVETPIGITVTAINGLTATLSGAGLIGAAAGFLAYGYIALGSGRTLRRANIQNSAADSGGGSVVCVLNQVLPASYVGVTGTASVGCDLSYGATGCERFANQINFGGHPFLPPQNPSIVINTPNTNKK